MQGLTDAHKIVKHAVSRTFYLELIAPRSGQFLAFQKISFFHDDQHCAKLIRSNFVKADVNPEFQRANQVEGAPNQQALLRALGGVQPVQRAVVAPPTIIWGIGAQAGIAQFLAAQRPMHEEPERRIIRPLPR